MGDVNARDRAVDCAHPFEVLRWHGAARCRFLKVTRFPGRLRARRVRNRLGCRGALDAELKTS